PSVSNSLSRRPVSLATAVKSSSPLVSNAQSSSLLQKPDPSPYRNHKGKVVILDDDNETECQGRKNDGRGDRAGCERKERKENEDEDEKYEMPSTVAYNIFRQIVEASNPSNPD